jgi:phosphatidylcholine synthase
MSIKYNGKIPVTAWLVHLYTSLGLPLALLSMMALFEKKGDLFFMFNFAAVAIDSTDGFLARSMSVKTRLPHFNGAKLDDLIDFLTFTFLPLISLVALDLLSIQHSMWLSIPLIASAYGFCQEQAKTEESFVGFPSYWNIVALYLFYFQPDSWVIYTILMILAIFTFIPIHYIYPTRTQLLFKTTMIGGTLFFFALFWIAYFPKVFYIQWVVTYSLIYVAYYTVLSFYHHYQVVIKPKRSS